MHTATDIHSHDVGNHSLAQISSETYDATGPCVHVGYDTYLTILEHVNGEQCGNLVYRHIFNVVREYLHVKLTALKRSSLMQKTADRSNSHTSGDNSVTKHYSIVTYDEIG